MTFTLFEIKYKNQSIQVMFSWAANLNVHVWHVGKLWVIFWQFWCVLLSSNLFVLGPRAASKALSSILAEHQNLMTEYYKGHAQWIIEIELNIAMNCYEYRG